MSVPVSSQAREYPEAEKTLRMAAHLLIKAVLQYLPVLVPQPDFGECWQRVLQVLQVSSARPCHMMSLFAQKGKMRSLAVGSLVHATSTKL